MLKMLYRFVPEKPFGIYISDTDVTAIQLAGSKDRPRLRALGKSSFPQGIVENGELLREKELATYVSALLRDTTPFSITTKKCWIALPEKQIFEHIFPLPTDLSEREFKNFLEQHIEETIPLPLHEIKYDYYVFDFKGGMAVFVAAARKLIIAQYYELFKSLCGLDPLGIEPESLSLLRNIPVNFSSDSGMLFIHSDGDIGRWFLLLRERIFDSSSFTFRDFTENPQCFIGDVKKSMQRFSDTVQSSVTAVVVSGKDDFLAKACEISTVFGLPICTSEDHLVNIPQLGNDQGRDFRIAAGIAFKIFGDRFLTTLNLFKK